MLTCSPNQASSRERSQFCMLYHLFSSRVTGPVVLPSRRHGKAIAGTVGGSCTPTGQPRCTTPHSSPPNQCLPTHTPRPKKKETEPSAREGRRRGTEPDPPFALCPAGKDPPGDDDKPCTGGGTVGDRKHTFRLNAVPE